MFGVQSQVVKLLLLYVLDVLVTLHISDVLKLRVKLLVLDVLKILVVELVVMLAGMIATMKMAHTVVAVHLTKKSRLSAAT